MYTLAQNRFLTIGYKQSVHIFIYQNVFIVNVGVKQMTINVDY